MTYLCLKDFLLQLRLEDNNEILNLPNLEYLTYMTGSYNYIIDLKSCNKLKYFKGNKNFFFDIKDKPLEIIDLQEQIKEKDENINWADFEKKIIEELISMKTLKEIKICLTNLNIEISKYLEKNIGVEKLSIFWNKNINCCKLNNFQKLFPNISLLFVQITAKDKVQKDKIRNQRRI